MDCLVALNHINYSPFNLPSAPTGLYFLSCLLEGKWSHKREDTFAELRNSQLSCLLPPTLAELWVYTSLCFILSVH